MSLPRDRLPIISKADQETSSLQAWLDLMLKPYIEDLMEKDIGQHGGNGSPLHNACVGMVQHPFFPDPGTEPFPNKAHYPPIIDSVAERFPQSSPVNTVERPNILIPLSTTHRSTT